MKKRTFIAMCLVASMGICSCGVQQTDTSSHEETSTIETTMEEIFTTEKDEETSSEEKTTEETTELQTEASTTEEVVLHSPFYIEGYSVEDVIRYFSEVVLNSEYPIGDGDFSLVQKWTAPIRCAMYGDPTQEDQEKLLTFFEQLNEIEGFPGISVAQEGEWVNLPMYFQVREDFYANFGNLINYEEADGAVEYWYYNDTNELFEARIGYRTDIDQSIRNAVLLEEVMNGLGMGTDTTLREDSIIYQWFNEVQELSEMDWLILKLLYHPEMKCGMNYDACSEVIERLYY